MLNQLCKRHEKTTVLVTLSVSKDTNINSITKQLRREQSTANNIKDKHTSRKVQMALRNLEKQLIQTAVNNGFIAFSAFDGV